MAEPAQTLEIEGKKYSLQDLVDAWDSRNSRLLFNHGLEVVRFLDTTFEQLEGTQQDNMLAVIRATAQKYFFNNCMGSGHVTNWNDAFYVANRFKSERRFCDLEKWEKKTSAIMALWNGRHGYFELNTHQGFDVGRLITEMGLSTPEQIAEMKAPVQFGVQVYNYAFLPKQVHDNIKNLFGLKREELLAAPLLCENAWEKTRGENGISSGQYGKLHVAYELDSKGFAI